MMKKLSIKSVRLTILFFVVAFVYANSQVLLKEVPLKDQIDNSKLVIEGKVVSKQSFWDVGRKNIYTVNTINVFKVFKGKPVHTIEIVTLGGTVGSEALIVSPSLKLREGDIGVFTLTGNRRVLEATAKSSNTMYKPYASLQSFFKYSLYNGEVINSFNKKRKNKTSFYEEIMRHTKSDFLQISAIDNDSNSTKKGLVAPSNITFDLASATAGTKTVLTINGDDFGGTQGKVGFSNADDGGFTSVFALDSQVTEWTGTQIKVEIPSEAGTGPILVQNSSEENGFSASSLTITYAQINAIFDPDFEPDNDPNNDPDPNGPLGLYAYPTRHINDQGGGYVWEMQTDFFNDTNSNDAFTASLDKWRCETKVNWVISSTPTAVDVAESDGVNVVRYDNEGVDDLDPGVLGVCYSRINGCGSIGNVNSWNAHVFELDIVFDSGTEWYFGSGPIGIPDFSKYDFESVALHELGHGHQLGHVIDPTVDGDNLDDVMHYALSNAEIQRVLSTGNKNAANNVHSRSTSVMACSQAVMTDSTICNLSLEDLDLEDAISIFPNPARGEFFIGNASTINLTRASIYDVGGRLISEYNLSGGSNIKTINLESAAKGVYFVKIQSENGSITRKIVQK
ncbi:T9SS type A sorting domain-containing protein [Tamlana sp. 2201CG12-4]|uniref:T9SS type A sorting domain-containing protein n=1 Tax=Tamlana sp. 2201CG12-4 TaxID=3112582 RepID=UPI002DBB21FB|nr:T9SS type A sorting domain-containing protein [Tamlana sp. 2201CG12-4]MEC3906539.1 T9SS type A sorting domain-containing protein [Tamlana sp. 2201CG12-4]